MTITVELGWYSPKVTILKVFECQAKLLLVDLVFIRLGLWRGDVRWALIETVKSLAQDKQWLIDNAPAVRIAKRLAYSKGKAEGIETIGNERDYWKDSAHKNWAALQKAQRENVDLSNALRALRRIDAQITQ